MVMTLVFLNGKFLNMTVGNPIPWGCPEGCSIFFSEKGPKLEILAFWRVSRHPQHRAQFEKSRPGVGRPSACRLTWSKTCQIAPWAGGVGSVNVAVAACLVLVADWRKGGFKFECMRACTYVDEIKCV
jgi:hypothetical protein